VVAAILRQHFDEGLGVAAGSVGGEAFEARRIGRLPFGEEFVHAGLERGELRVPENGGLHVGSGQFTIAGVFRLFEQGGAHGGDNLPVTIKGVDVTLRDAAAQMAVDVLDVLRLGAVDVAREIEVEVVLRVTDFRDRHHAGVARDEHDLDNGKPGAYAPSLMFPPY
jgi:hypothetical protein